MKTTKMIKALESKRDKLKLSTFKQIELIQASLNKEYKKQFSKDKDLTKAIASVESSNEYGIDQDVYRWTRFDVSTYANYMDALRDHLSELCIHVNADHDALLMYEGDCLIIQDDVGRDNGVWLNHKCVIDEREYKTDDNEIDETLRNSLIEAYMEKTGCFPSVVRIDRYSNVTPVNTQATK